MYDRNGRVRDDILNSQKKTVQTVLNLAIWQEDLVKYEWRDGSFSHSSHLKVIDLKYLSLGCIILYPYWPWCENSEVWVLHKNLLSWMTASILLFSATNISHYNQKYTEQNKKFKCLENACVTRKGTRQKWSPLLPQKFLAFVIRICRLKKSWIGTSQVRISKSVHHRNKNVLQRLKSIKISIT
jgi:hypothetical protein